MNPVVGADALDRWARASAPVRVADVGGWTDTWFGSPGAVCHVAVGPGIEVTARVVHSDDQRGPVRLRAASLGLDESIGPSGDPSIRWDRPLPGRHPLLEHAVASVVEGVDFEPGVGLAVDVTSSVPPGASLGTSASVVVALIGALDRLVGGGQLSAADVARQAHDTETRRAGREAGVQDQWAAALGGVGLLAIGVYPEVVHQRVPLTVRTEHELADRLVTVVFGSHDPSLVHAEVINAMVGCGGDEHDRARRALRTLARLAGSAAQALASGEIETWAAILSAATRAQQELHDGLVGTLHRAAIDCAERAGALGWKVNGAGGEGGSLTVVAPDREGAQRIRRELADGSRGQVVDLAPSTGLTIIEG